MFTLRLSKADLFFCSIYFFQVEAGIISAREEIDETKAELVEAKRVRKNRMEYDALAKVSHSYYWN